MNKAQFIEALATRLDTDRRAAQTYLDAVFETIYATVSKGEEVVLTGFGKFEKRDRAARTARNPATGAPVRVKKTSVPGFKAGTEFKAIISGAKKIAKAPAKKAPAKRAAAATKAAPARAAAATKAAPARAAKKAASATTTATKAPARASKATATKTAAKAPARSASRTPAKAPAKKAPARKAPARKTAR